MSKSLEELQIGNYANIVMWPTTTLYVALGIFVQHRVSALPVVDEKGEGSGTGRRAPGRLGKSAVPSAQPGRWFCRQGELLMPDPPWLLPLSPRAVVDIYSKFDVIEDCGEGGWEVGKGWGVECGEGEEPFWDLRAKPKLSNSV